MRRWRAAAALAGLLAVAPAVAGPVFVTLDGPRFCPRDRAQGAPALAEADAVERARTMLPAGYCGPSVKVDGCDAEAERVAETFRVYFHQYKLRGGRHDGTLLAHTYVILDRVGNCLAHIPGTGVFEAAH